MQTDVPCKNGSRYMQHCKCDAYEINEINPLCLISRLPPFSSWANYRPSGICSVSVHLPSCDPWAHSHAKLLFIC